MKKYYSSSRNPKQGVDNYLRETQHKRG